MWELSDMADADELRGKRLYDALMALKPKELAATDWAVKAGVNRGFFTDLKSNPNSSLRTDTLRKVLRHIGKTEADLYGEMPVRKEQPDLTLTRIASSDDDTVEIIALDLSLSMGPGTLIEEYAEEQRVRMSLAFVQAITRTPSDRLRLVRGIGDSMEPTLRTGDRVMIDINERQLARSHGVYWVDHLGTHGMKRLRAASRSKVLIISDNPVIDNYEVDAEELIIHGRAIWFARDL